jgi:hypothetical protein
MNGCKAFPYRGKAKSKVLCIQTRRILWQKKDQQHVRQLVNLRKLLLEKQNADQLVEKELQLASSSFLRCK